MSNSRKLRRINPGTGLLQRPKTVWGRTAPLRSGGFTRSQISGWLDWRQQRNNAAAQRVTQRARGDR